MNNDFNITKEETFSFKGGKLCLMMLRENASYGVEIVDCNKTFGRKMADGRDDAENIFDILSDRLSSFKTLEEAESFIMASFKLKTKDKFKFALIALNAIVTQDDIVSLKKDDNKFKMRLQFNYRKKIKEKDALTIYIYFGKEKKPFGLLVGSTKVDDLKFEFL